jgi:phage tail-like protein
MAILREELPYLPINFQIDLQDGSAGTTAGTASDVTGLAIEMPTIEYRHGSAKTNYTTKMVALSKAGDVTIKRGVIGAENMYKWIEDMRTGNVKAKRTVSISLSDENPQNDTPVVTWKLLGAMPIKWNGPTLSAKNTSDVAFEEIVLSVDHLEQA